MKREKLSAHRFQTLGRTTGDNNSLGLGNPTCFGKQSLSMALFNAVK